MLFLIIIAFVLLYILSYSKLENDIAKDISQALLMMNMDYGKHLITYHFGSLFGGFGIFISIVAIFI